MGGDRPTIDPQRDTEPLNRRFDAVMTVVSIGPEGTFVANFHRSGGITVETASFRDSDMAADVKPVVGRSYRSMGTLRDPQIRPLTEEDERELFNQDPAPGVADALESLRQLIAASKR